MNGKLSKNENGLASARVLTPSSSAMSETKAYVRFLQYEARGHCPLYPGNMKSHSNRPGTQGYEGSKMKGGGIVHSLAGNIEVTDTTRGSL